MKITNQELLYMNALGQTARVSPMECFVDSNEEIVFVVNPKDISKAIGKNGITIKKLKEKLGKNIQIIPYAKTAKEFVKKYLYQLKIQEIKESENEHGSKILTLNFNNENKTNVKEHFGKIKRLKELMKIKYKINNVKISYLE